MHEARLAIEQLADRYLVRLAAHQACAGTGVRLASAGLTPAVVEAFAEGFYLPQHQGRVAFGGLVRKLKKLVAVFRKAPQLWDRFKKLIGIESITQIPKAIKALAAKAKKLLRKLITKLFNTWPLRIYTLEKGKVRSFNEMLSGMMAKSPKLKKALDSGIARLGGFGEMLRKKAPHIAGVLMVGIYIWVWMNVVEFEWDMKGLTDAITGAMSFPDFMASLPGSAFGAILNVFGFATFTLLPFAVAARILFMVQHRYVSWSGRGFSVDWELMKADFNLSGASEPIPARQ
jgi:hypothetical protein